MKDLNILQISNLDLPLVADIHLRAFPNGSISKLGKDAIIRYYEYVMTVSILCFPIAVFQSNEMLGFCFSGILKDPVSGFIRSNIIFLSLRILMRPWLIIDDTFQNGIKIGLKALKIFKFRKNQKIKNNQRISDKETFTILFIATDPSIQKKGVGKSLMLAAEKIAVEHGFSNMDLTVSPKNLQAINFYIGLGWVKTGSPWAGLMFKKLSG